MAEPQPGPDLPTTDPSRPTAPGEDQSTASFADPQATCSHHPAEQPGPDTEAARPRLAGYEVLDVLGRGGMGVVYKAHHLALKRTVALKMVLAGGQAGPRELARFRAEAEAVARLQHPNIVQIHEVGEWRADRLSSPVPFIALEFVEGGSLAQKLGGRPLPFREAARLVETLAGAMHLAHSRNVVHRDLKPANVLLTAGGVPKVTDFGLARQLDVDSGQTQAGAVMGTPSYMAPEQAGGQAHQAGPAADVYALGAILYECLTGRPPFRSRSVAETLDQVRTREPVAPRALQAKVPADLETICLKCLRKEPEQRYAGALDLAEDLRRFQEGRPIAARPVGWAERAAKWVRRNPAVAVLTAGVSLSVVVGAVAAWLLALQALASEKRAKQEEAKALQKADDETRAHETAEHQLAVSKVLLAQAAWRDANVGNARALLNEVRPESRGWEWGHLRRLFQGGHLTLYGHAEMVQGVAFSPDGTRVATASHDGTARVWDVGTGQELATLKGHTTELSSLAFSPDGQRLVTGSADRTAKVWDVRGGPEVLTLKGHSSSVSGLAFSPDGRRLASASADGTARVRDARTGEEVLTLTAPIGGLTGVAFAPDGRLATAGNDGTARVWDATTGQQLLLLDGHSRSLTAVAFGANGTRLATASNDGTAKVWDADTGQELVALKAHTGVVYGVTFSPDGTRLATASQDFTAKVWDARTGAELLTLRGHGNAVSGVAFSADGTRLATAGQDSTARVWDAQTGRLLLTLKGHSNLVGCVAFSPDGRRLVTGSPDQTAKVWDAATGQELVTLKHTGFVHAVAFSPDRRRLATAGRDGTVKVWDAPAGAERLALKGHNDQVSGVAFSPDGTHLATAGHDGTAKLWDAATGHELLALKGHARELHSVAFSADGRRLASASWDGTAKVWDASTGEDLLTLKGHTGNVFGVAFSPDGTRLATGGRDTTARVWDAATGRELLTIKGNTLYVTSVAFSPDGRSLVTRDAGGNILTWDAQTGDPLADARQVAVSTPHPALSSNGRWLAHIDDDVVYLHDLRQPVDEDERAFRAALARLDPDWQDEQARRCEQSGQWFAAAFHLDRAVSAWLDRPALYLRRGRARAELGRWQGARDDFARAVEHLPEQPEAWRGLALSELALHRPDAYRQTCARFVQHWGQPPEAGVVGLLFSSSRGDALGTAGLTWAAVKGTPALVAACRAAARTCVLRPDALSGLGRLLPLAGGDPVVRGALLCRAGRFDEAVLALSGNTDAVALLYRALAEHGRGKDGTAKQTRDEAVRWLEAPSAADPKQTNAERLPWDQRLETDLLRQEAVTLLRGNGTGGED